MGLASCKCASALLAWDAIPRPAKRSRSRRARKSPSASPRNSRNRSDAILRRTGFGDAQRRPRLPPQSAQALTRLSVGGFVRVLNEDDRPNDTNLKTNQVSALRRHRLLRQHGIYSRLSAFFLLLRAADTDRAGHLSVDQNWQCAGFGEIVDPH